MALQPSYRLDKGLLEVRIEDRADRLIGGAVLEQHLQRMPEIRHFVHQLKGRNDDRVHDHAADSLRVIAHDLLCQL